MKRRLPVGVILFSLYFLSFGGFLRLVMQSSQVLPPILHVSLHAVFGVIGILLLLGNEWARKALIVLYPPYLVLNLVYTDLPAVVREELAKMPQADPAAMKAVVYGVSIATALALWAIVHFYFTRRKVKSFFNPA